jgi:signal recognition particle receptor subunit beta
MASINRLKRELLFKIVFYGPGLGGKTTTLKHVHSTAKPDSRGNLVSLATDTDRTLYFDYLPVRLLKLGDVAVKLAFIRCPGRCTTAATRKLVLSGPGGYGFVAYTQTARIDADRESLDDLNPNLAEQGSKLSGVPHVFQWNKRDLPDVVPLDELDRRLNLFGAPSIATVATTGQGVFDVLDRITHLVVDAYRAELPISGKRDGGPLFLDAEEVGLADAIRDRGFPAGTSTVEPAGANDPRRVPTDGHLARRAGRARSGDDSNPHATPAPTNAGAAFSLTDLWPSADRDGARRVRARALAARDPSAAVAASEDLLSRVLAAGSMLLGGQTHPRDPALIADPAGVDGTRYLAFRAGGARRRARRSPTLRDALRCYMFAVEARRARARPRDQAVTGC